VAALVGAKAPRRPLPRHPRRTSAAWSRGGPRTAVSAYATRGSRACTGWCRSRRRCGFSG